MPMTTSRSPEIRILVILAIIALSWHLLRIFGSLLGIFTDVFLILFLSWILSFILEPFVVSLQKHSFNRIFAAALVYCVIALLFLSFVVIVIPTTITQVSQFSTIIPAYLPQNSIFSSQLQAFLTSSLSNSIALISRVASGLAGLILIFILSFYFLFSKKEISQTIKKIIPDQYEDAYAFLEKVINTSFASFVRVQVFLGLALGLVTFVSLTILGINFALSTSLASAILAMIPVIGAVLFLLPPILAAVTISFEKLAIIVIVLLLAAQLVYNIWAPKLLGQVLKIHPIIVLVSFLIGYKIAGIWGAVFAVPITSSVAIIGKDLLKYWQEAADK